jgi:putative tryptophan/tyrosine transport system substrate-binding protein
MTNISAPSKGVEGAFASRGSHLGMVFRRRFYPVPLLTLLALLPAVAVAQSPKVYRLAHLSTAGRTADAKPPALLREGLRDLGYVEGQNIFFEARFAEGNVDRLPPLAAELLALGVDVIVAQGRPAVVAAKQATSTIPIVIAPASSDAVATGLIDSLSRPGGNVTGLTDELEQLSAKRVQILREALPRADRIAVLWNVNDPAMQLRFRAIEAAAKGLRVEIASYALQSPKDFEPAFADMAKIRPDALFLVTDALTNMNQKRVIEFSTTQRVPAMFETSPVVRQGGLMSYGPSPRDMFRTAAGFIDKILKGAKPSEMPAEQPVRFELVVNLKTAKALGLTFPPTILVRADEVIE